jgi:ADP-ribosylglycohydrolase
VLRDKVAGGWYGRIAGCILGKPVECLMKHRDSRAQLKRVLQESGEYPLRDFVSQKSMVPYWKSQGTLPDWFQAGKGNGSLREYINGAPADDDLNYTVLALDFLRRKGSRFTPDNLLDEWLGRLPFLAVCTAEKLAYRNRVMGMSYPQTATFLNPYGEWIGAQIRADAYGYIAPGQPEEAARMAWNDAAASHVKNGIYGAMWVAAAIAAAYAEDEPEAVILRGLEQVPARCRFTEHMLATVTAAQANGEDFELTFKDIDRRLGHYHCVHTVNNACIVAAALMHGKRDLGRTICIAVMGGLDTDCNGATAGSIAGVMIGEKAIPRRWRAPFRDTLHTSIVGRDTVKISALVEQTLELIAKLGG